MLGDVFASHPHVGDIRGRGLFLALELVRDRASKEPFAPELKLHAAIKAKAMQRGLMVYPMGGTIDGRKGDHVLLAPPFIVSAAQLSEIVARLEEAVNAAIREVA
jgi:adenosylmethionine-8-amino-7-oxononanoate aminotransferase